MIKIKFVLEEKRAIAYDNDIEVGECIFIEKDNTWNIIHTEVNKSYQGKGIARMLVQCVIENALNHGKELEADCSYANKIMFP